MKKCRTSNRNLERERERERSVQSPRTVGAPTAALTATSRAICNDELMRDEKWEQRTNKLPNVVVFYDHLGNVFYNLITVNVGHFLIPKSGPPF